MRSSFRSKMMRRGRWKEAEAPPLPPEKKGVDPKRCSEISWFSC